METVLHEWGALLLRWTHIITGIAWIGSSFYFMHLDAAIRDTPDIEPGKGGEAWEVHGGGFYQVKKYLVAPSFLPEHLMWHKWESYMTWVSGFSLLMWVYYYQASLYLIDPTVRALTPFTALLVGLGGLAAGWFVYNALCKSPLGKNDTQLAAVGFVFVILMAVFFQLMFSPRGAFIHTGAMMATIMTGNVFFIIMPNQRKSIAALQRGEVPDPAWGKAAKQRSAHNNYLTLPVIFLMLSSHYPLTYSSPLAFLIVASLLVAGALVRVFYNQRHAGNGDQWWCWALAAGLVAFSIVISAHYSPETRDQLGLGPMPDEQFAANAPKAPPQIAEIVQSRCAMCHAQTPVWEGIGVAPKGVRLDTPEGVAHHAQEIYEFAVQTHAMPPNNITGMEVSERRALGKWIASLN